MTDIVLRHADTHDELLSCFVVMSQPRHDLRQLADFVARVRRLATCHYRILAAWKDDISWHWPGTACRT